MLENQLATYLTDTRSNIELYPSKNLYKIAERMVEKKKNCIYLLVHKLEIVAKFTTYSWNKILIFENKNKIYKLEILGKLTIYN